MLFYLVVTPVFAWTLFELLVLLGQRKHDRVLFRFCHIRGELVRHVRDHVDDFSRDDYLYAREMLMVLNRTVSIYPNHRSEFFNFRAFEKFLHRYLENATELARMPRTERADLKDFEHRVDRAMIFGFMCYTPFLRSEIFARFILALARLLARMGAQAFAVRAQATMALVADAQREMQHALTGEMRTA